MLTLKLTLFRQASPWYAPSPFRNCCSCLRNFVQLNLKNDTLRRRYDTLKYDIKKIEEGQSILLSGHFPLPITCRCTQSYTTFPSGSWPHHEQKTQRRRLKIKNDDHVLYPATQCSRRFQKLLSHLEDVLWKNDRITNEGGYE